MQDLEQKFKTIFKKLNLEFRPATELMNSYASAQRERNALKSDFLETYAPKLPLRPSSAAICGRKLWFELNNFFKPGSYPTEPIDLRGSRVFEMGNVVEDFELGKLSGYHGFRITHRQQKLDIGTIDGHAMSGSIDGILWFEGRPLLIDVKSSNTYKYARITRDLEPSFENVVQMSLYHNSATYKQILAEQGVKIEDSSCALLYINKDSQEYFIIEFTPDPKLAEAVIRRLQTVYDLYKKGVMPQRDYVKTEDSYPCSYCAFNKYCMAAPDPDGPKEISDELGQKVGSLPEDQAIMELWSQGDYQVYQDSINIYTVEKLKTKWALKIKAKLDGKTKNKTVNKTRVSRNKGKS